MYLESKISLNKVPSQATNNYLPTYATLLGHIHATELSTFKKTSELNLKLHLISKSSPQPLWPLRLHLGDGFVQGFTREKINDIGTKDINFSFLSLLLLIFTFTFTFTFAFLPLILHQDMIQTRPSALISLLQPIIVARTAKSFLSVGMHVTAEVNE